MFDKILKIISPNTESVFINYILPTILCLIAIILLWLSLLSMTQFIKIKAEKWKAHKYLTSFSRRFVVTQKSLIRKTLTSIRRALTLYLLLLLAIHILNTFSSDLKEYLKLSLSPQTEKIWFSFIQYADSCALFLTKFNTIMLNIFFTVLIAIWCIRILEKTLDMWLHKEIKSGVTNSRSIAKKSTLNLVTGHLLKVVISVLAIFTILQNLGINIAALLATAGLASVAIGFGAQSLVKDFIAGFFILFEDQFAVGDNVELYSTSSVFLGTIEKMTLRMVRVRSNEGSLLTIPNGDIRSVKNYSTDWSRIDFKYNLSLTSQVEKAMAIFCEEVNQLCSDFSSDILETPDIRPFEKIVDFENRSVAATLRAYIKTTNVKTKVKLEIEFNKRLLARFKAEEIVIISHK